jgi:preprotein translocase subunit SecE
VAPIATVQDGDAAATTTATAAVAEKPVARSTSKNGPAGATTRSRTAHRAETPPAISPWKRIVNPDRFEGIRKFIRDAMSEIKKVIWPDRETTRNLTLVVIAVSIVLGILLGGIDYVLFQLFEALP